MHKHEFAIIKMFRSGANGYLLKNCNPTELQKAIITIHEKGLYFSEIVSNHLFHRIKNTYLLPSLTEKEIQLLKLCYSDLTYKEIGVKMGVSERSVAGYRDNLFKKFEVNSRPALVVCAIKMGLVAID
jgi:DNA-binding NarL/FixJ family response regulator